MQPLTKILLSVFTIVAFTSYAAYAHSLNTQVQTTGGSQESVTARQVSQEVPVAVAATPSVQVSAPQVASPSTNTAAVTTQSPAPEPVTQPVSAPEPAIVSSGAFRDGTYTGTSVDAYYGYVQVQAVIVGGKLTNVTVLQYPNDRRDSIEINNYALPRLKQQAIAAQSAKINGVSGATDTTYGFVQSLASALLQAS